MKMRGSGSLDVSNFPVQMIDLVFIDDDDDNSSMFESPSELILPVIQKHFQPFQTSSPMNEISTK